MVSATNGYFLAIRLVLNLFPLQLKNIRLSLFIMKILVYDSSFLQFQKSVDGFYHLPRATNRSYYINVYHKDVESHRSLLTFFRLKSFAVEYVESSTLCIS